MPFQKGNKVSKGKGRPQGAKSKISESFYELCLRYQDDPEGLGGYEGLKAFFNKCPRNKEMFVAMMAKWAEKQLRQAIDIGNAPGEDGKGKAFLVKVIHVKGSDKGNGNGSGNGDGRK